MRPVTERPPDRGIWAGVAQLVEHHVANVDVAGSNPVSRSISSSFLTRVFVSPDQAKAPRPMESEESALRSTLMEGRDFYWEAGLMVMTAEYLRRRGYCCESGCRHCPYGEDPSHMETEAPPHKEAGD
jgi:hypothetical protein